MRDAAGQGRESFLPFALLAHGAPVAGDADPVDADPNRTVEPLDRAGERGQRRLRLSEPEMLAPSAAAGSRESDGRDDQREDEKRYEKYASGVCVFRKQARDRCELPRPAT